MTPAQARAALARQLDAHGETVTLRRLAGTGAGDYDVCARVMNMAAADIAGNTQQLRRKAIVSAEDVETIDFPTPFLPKQDRLVWNSKVLTITAVDDGTRRIQGTLIAYELELAGG